MCRHLIANKKGIFLIEKNYGGLLKYLYFLEKERGGNGRGYLLVKEGKIFKFQKGIDYPSLEDVAKTLMSENYDYVLFHSRLATIGSLNDYNCHPFVLKDNLALSMNGSEDEYMQMFYKDDHTYSDSQRIAYDFYKSNQSPKEFLMNRFDSVFMGIYEGRPFVASNYEKNIKLLTTGNINFLQKEDPIVFASDFPWQFNGQNIYDVINPYFYYDENEKDLSQSLRPSLTGYDAILDGLKRQFPKYIDTKITLLAQKSSLSEESYYSLTLEKINDLSKTDEVKSLKRVRKN